MSEVKKAAMEQFLANGSQTVPVRGMKLWPDEAGTQPRDMSWGYVDSSNSGRGHVHHRDYVVAEPGGNGFYVVPASVIERKRKK